MNANAERNIAGNLIKQWRAATFVRSAGVSVEIKIQVTRTTMRAVDLSDHAGSQIVKGVTSLVDVTVPLVYRRAKSLTTV